MVASFAALEDSADQFDAPKRVGVKIPGYEDLAIFVLGISLFLQVSYVGRKLFEEYSHFKKRD